MLASLTKTTGVLRAVSLARAQGSLCRAAGGSAVAQRYNSSNSGSGRNGGKVFEIKQSEFEEKVLASDVPTIVDFYAAWCQPCKMLAPLLKSAVEKNGQVNLVKIDIDESLDLAHDYRITSLPTVMAFRDGEPVSAFIGMRPAAAIEQFINDVANNTASSSK
ncbi:hypothetical protein GGI15_002804 [Coemansia interrupta]|uniref:Thioredoxin domain-containing protein n=1 Tax=Coemansia interrupta TaxID=1126814 RepID=A0A9W8LI84_9FUNG|nr:hypothetical protein GGI15_002804 [Coemansia interrupta]